MKLARESFKPSVEKYSRKYDASKIFVNPKLDETLYSALKSVKNSSASVANIDAIEKMSRRHTDLTLDLGKALLFLNNKAKFKKKSSCSRALRALTVLWSHLLRDITRSRRLNILSQVHPNHVGLLTRSADLLPIGGDDLFGGAFIKELLSQVQTAALVNSSVAPVASSTPKPSIPRPPHLSGPGASNNSYSNNNNYNRYVISFSLFSFIFFLLVVDVWRP